MMKRSVISMRILFLFTLGICLFSLNACKKDKGSDGDTDSDTFISFKADGVSKTYTVAGYNLFTESNTYVCNVNASSKDVRVGESINVLIRSLSPITKGSYGNDNAGCSIQYHPGSNLTYIVVNSDVRIIVDKFGNDIIEGNFSGTIPTANGSIKITEGTFKCKPRA